MLSSGNGINDPIHSRRVMSRKTVTVIVAHPDDEVLWAGGLLQSHPEWQVSVYALCRASDPDRAPKFRRALDALGASGAIADLDDGPDQAPLHPDTVSQTIIALTGSSSSDKILTHGPRGEYTRHRRHEETCEAVVSLWEQGRIAARELWMFAYEDGGRAYLPKADERAHERVELPRPIWERKYELITALYGFAPDSWEARATPRIEAFRRFGSPQEARQWVAEERTR